MRKTHQLFWSPASFLLLPSQPGVVFLKPFWADDCTEAMPIPFINEGNSALSHKQGENKVI